MKKKQTTEERFEEMAQQLITDMECVDCPPRTYLEGLKTAMELLRDRYYSYKSEVEGREVDRG